MITSVAVLSPHRSLYEEIDKGLPYLVELVDIEDKRDREFYYDLILLDEEFLDQKKYPEFMYKWENLFKEKPLIIIANKDFALKNLNIDYVCDFLFHPFSQTELEIRVKRSLAPRSFQRLAQEYAKVCEEKKELEENNVFLKQLVVTDSLTGVANRRYLLERLEEEFLEAQRRERNISMLMIDIDFFKKVNDKYGHQCGDYVLSEFAAILRKNVRRKEVVARYGGEEFAIALFDTPLASAVLIAERINQDVRNYVFEYQTRTFQITCSLGVSSYPELCPSPNWNQLISAADAALYRAKNTGRDRICYPPESEQ